MAQNFHARPRRRSGMPVLLSAAFVLAGLAGGAGALHAAGVVEIPFLAAKAPPAAAPDLTGYVRVPSTARPVAAYAAVTRDDLWNAQRQTLTMVMLRKQDVAPGMLTDLGSIIGRVLRHEKPAGYVFMDSDFFPRGTRPGPTAGVPPGKRALRLKASDVPGLHGLNQGDRFDLVMTEEVELEQPPLQTARKDDGLKVDGPYAALRFPANATPGEEPVRLKRKHAEVKTIVNNGIVVEPVQQRQEISKSSTLLRGTTIKSTPVEELIIAVDPDEVAELNLALAVGAHLQVAMRSGQIDDGVDEGEIPDIRVDPSEDATVREDAAAPKESPVQVVEVIEGGKKRLNAVPRRADVQHAPTEAPKAPRSDS